MNRHRLIWAIVVVGVLLAEGLFWFVGEINSKDIEEEICVAASCCHAVSCVWESEAPDCDGMFCTMSCEIGTMDCGQGRCGIVDGKCGVIWNE